MQIVEKNRNPNVAEWMLQMLAYEVSTWM